MGSGVREGVGVGRGDGVGGGMVGVGVGVGWGVFVGDGAAVGAVCTMAAVGSAVAVSWLAAGWPPQASAAMAVPAAAQSNDIMVSRFIEYTLCDSATTNHTETRCGSKPASV